MRIRGRRLILVAYAKPWGRKKVFRLRPDWEIMDNRVCEDLPLANFESKVKGKRPE